MGRQNSGSLAKERDNMQSELVMRKAVLSIQEAVDRDPQAHRHVIQTLQRENWNRRWRKVRELWAWTCPSPTAVAEMRFRRVAS